MTQTVGDRLRPDPPASSVASEQNKLHEIAGGAASVDLRIANYKPFGRFWGSSYFTKWAVISHALFDLGLQEGQTILDVGVGGGWTTIFLSETGFQATGVDIAPGHVAVGRRRADRYGAAARFEIADMDTLDLGTAFDAVLVFDALHHTMRQREVVKRLARHVKPGGWILFGEPSWMHAISPHARRMSKELGWVERGIFLRTLKRDCRDAGLTEFRRFYEGTAPFTTRVSGFAWELARLVGAQFNVSPQTSLWLAARRV
jgi:2-polyprenyl-3-methyl-5-hydroxy-6-metoxy-1,4-benzoquinol methylase